MIFGISGCSASGKSFIVDYLKNNISSSKVSFIYQDNYYQITFSFNREKLKSSEEVHSSKDLFQVIMSVHYLLKIKRQILTQEMILKI